MSTFYVKNNQIDAGKIAIIGEDVKHIKNVLRYKIGDNIDICSENGTKYESKISSIESEQIVADILKEYETTTEPTINVTLFQGLPKSDKMDFIVQKCTEIGVKNIVPVIMDRVIVKVDDNNSKKKVERWNKIAYESSKQSGRQIVPKVENIVNLKNIIENLSKYDIVLLPYEGEKESTIKEVLKNASTDWKNIGIIIGAEGGFSPEDLEVLQDEKIKRVTLGPRILRCETAGMVTLAIVMYELQK